LSLLAENPVWLTLVILYVATIGILPLGRWLFEGFRYNVALSSKYGDVALIVCVLIAASILKRQPVEPWLASSTFHGVAIGLSIGIGLIAEVLVRANPSLRMGCEIMDVYHNLFIVPLFVYLILAIAIPAIYLYGTGLQKIVSLSLLVAWATLFVYDLHTGRLNQREWLTKNDVPL